MKVTPVNTLFFILFTGSFSAFAGNEDTGDTLDEAFLEFLADLENINNNWTHPVDFEVGDTEAHGFTTTEINNE